MQDQPFAFLDDPRIAGLAGLAGGLLGAAGPTPYPVGMGGALGAGLGGGLAGLLGSRQALQDREYMALLDDIIARLRKEISGTTGHRGVQAGVPAAPPQDPILGPAAGAPTPLVAGMAVPMPTLPALPPLY